jgi:hypothetical protein
VSPASLLEPLNLERALDLQEWSVVIPHFNAHEVVRATFAHHLQGHFSQGQGGFLLNVLKRGTIATVVVSMQFVAIANVEIIAAHRTVIRMPVHIALNVRPVCRTHTFRTS